MPNLANRLRFLEIYAVTSTLIFASLTLCAFKQSKTRFEEIDVERINVVEKNGTLRAVIANTDRMPDPFIDGKSFKTERASGMLFYTRSGDECGGLTFDAVTGNGKYGAFGGLTIDQYKQSQTIGLMYNDHSGERRAGLNVWDRPDIALATLVQREEEIAKMADGPKKDEAKAKLKQEGAAPPRLFAGKTKTSDSTVTLSDAKGRPRINMVVTSAGDARIDFLDENGKVTKSVTGK